MSPHDRILLFIPVYRCEQQIGRVLRQITPDIAKQFTEILVVDNRSPDGTQNAAKTGLQAIDQCDVTLLCNDANYGLGGSHKIAFTYCLQKEYDAIIVLHGDDQADIMDIMPLMLANEHYKYDCLLGSRFARGSTLIGYSRLRTYGNHCMNALFTLVTGRHVQDLGAGLNMYTTRFLRSFPFSNLPDDLTFNVALLLGTLLRKLTLRFFPITWREEDQLSNAKLLHQSIRTLRLLLYYVLRPAAVLCPHGPANKGHPYTSSVIYSRVVKPRHRLLEDATATNARGKPVCI